MRSICRTCGRVFSNVTNFDRHRVGKYTNTPPHYGRGCATEAGLNDLGLACGVGGVWRKVAPSTRPASWRANP
jgi:hypothetical protein